MKISVINRDDIGAYESRLNAHLNSVFDQDVDFILNSEFVCAVVIEDGDEVVATGFAYSRLMQQNSTNFRAGIIGGVAVSESKRGLGLAKVIVKELDQYLLSSGVDHSFLFAYEPNIYRSSGYSELASPIHYLDLQQGNWNQFVYRGSMVKSYRRGLALTDQVIDFKGCVY